MSICGGIAGYRGKPVGIFIHNDAGSKNANKLHYENWLPTHNLNNGFANYYVAEDGILQAEDDMYATYHCAQTDGNTRYLSIEVCQSMGDLEVFKKNEIKALKLAAQKCIKYGIVPNESTIKLHQEVFATACPHRSVEIHGGARACKLYFIAKIKEYMGGNVVEMQSDTEQTEQVEEVIGGYDTMKIFYTIDGKAPVYYYNESENIIIPMKHPDEVTLLNKIHKDCTGRDIPCYSWSSTAPWYARLQEVVDRIEEAKK